MIREVQEETGLHIRSPQLCGIKDWCENQCRFVVLLYKSTCFDGELHSSSEGRVWWEDIANLPNLKLSLDMRDYATGFQRRKSERVLLLSRKQCMEVCLEIAKR